MSRIWLEVEDVIDIHALQIARFGGSPGIRDAGQLESALFRPRSGYYADIVEEAAALWESLSHNHPFVDGNKRTAFASMLIFLQLNGWRVKASAGDVLDFLIPLYETQTFSFGTLEPWLRKYAGPD